MEGFKSFFLNRRDLMRQFFLLVVIWVIAGVGVGVVGTAIMGCGCKNIMPQVVKAQNLVVDAQTSLAQAKAVFNALEKENVKLPTDVQSKLDKAMAEAEKGLRAALLVFDGAMDLCGGDGNVIDAFKDFNSAWKIIRDILPYASKGALRMGIVPTEGEPLIPDPTVFKMSLAN